MFFFQNKLFSEPFCVFASFKVNNITEDATQWDHIGQTQSDLIN
jgi:hypothetical protein